MPDDVRGSGRVLRRWENEDGEWYVAQLADAEIQRFTTESVTTTADEFRVALTELRHNAHEAGFAIIDPLTGRLAGNIGASLEHETADISYWLAPAARGQGLARSAVYELCTWIRNNWPQASLAQLWVHTDNVASVGVARSGGFVYDSTRDEARAVDGEDWPVHWYTRSW
ncbi:MAG: GNAT family protein [Nocardioidaceae bacterium]